MCTVKWTVKMCHVIITTTVLALYFFFPPPRAFPSHVIFRHDAASLREGDYAESHVATFAQCRREGEGWSGMSVDVVAFWEPRASKTKLKEVSRADLVDHSELLRLRERDYAESDVATFSQ